MKILFIITLLYLPMSYAQGQDQNPKPKKVERDEGDKQLLKRDTCRKPLEALETKYPDLSEKELKKMKAECDY